MASVRLLKCQRVRRRQTLSSFYCVNPPFGEIFQLKPPSRVRCKETDSEGYCVARVFGPQRVDMGNNEKTGLGRALVKHHNQIIQQSKEKGRVLESVSDIRDIEAVIVNRRRRQNVFTPWTIRDRSSEESKLRLRKGENCRKRRRLYTQVV